MKRILVLFILILLSANEVIAETYTYNSVELYRAYGKQQIKAKDDKGNRILLTPNYNSYEERNKVTSEKIVAIYDKRSPAYGYRYVLYTPIGNYVGHHKILQLSPNGYGYSPIPDGGEGSSTPCFESISKAKHYYYPQWY